MEHQNLGGSGCALKPSWSRDFASPRLFDRRSENQPYIDYIQKANAPVERSSLEIVSDNESGGCRLGEEEDEVAGVSDDESEDGTATDDGVEAVDVDRDDGVTVRNDNVVEAFMKGLEGLEDEEILLPYWDQVDVVTAFCAGTDLDHFRQGNPGAEATSLLYDDTSDSAFRQRRPSSGGLYRRLAPRQLFEELKKQRYRIYPSQEQLETAAGSGRSDVKRRLLYATNPNGWVIVAIAATAPRSHALALKNFFHRYLTGLSSFGTTISSHGFKTFNLDLHLSFYVIHGSEPTDEPRKRRDGTPLRQIWKLPSIRRSSTIPTNISRDDESAKVEYMQEAQFSLCFIGIDNWNWTAYSFVDPGPYSEDSTNRYHETQKSESVPRDPLTAGRVPVFDPANLSPRDYFIRILAIRIRPILKEWHRAERWAEEEITQFELMPIPLEMISRDAEQVRSRSVWVNDMDKTLRRLKSKLSKLIKAWQAFQCQDLSYFSEDDLSTNSSSLTRSLAMIDAVFVELQAILANLETLTQIVVEIRLSVTSHLSFENHLATVFQQKTAGHVKVLTVITIVFQPLVLTQGLFSTQGVLPFKPTLPYFIYALILSGVLVGTTSAVLFNWDRWCQWLVGVVRNKVVPGGAPSLKQSRRKRKDHIDSTEQRREVDRDTGAATSMAKRRGIIFRNRPRKHRLRDIETGIELSERKQS